MRFIVRSLERKRRPKPIDHIVIVPHSEQNVTGACTRSVFSGVMSYVLAMSRPGQHFRAEPVTFLERVTAQKFLGRHPLLAGGLEFSELNG